MRWKFQTVLIFCVIFTAGFSSYAQSTTRQFTPQKFVNQVYWPEAEALQHSLNAVFEKGNLMVAISGMEWRPGLCLASARVPAGESVALNVQLRANYNYSFIGAVDEAGRDVDFFLRDARGQVVAADEETDDSPIIKYRPLQDGTYQLQLHLVSSQAPAGFLSLSILRSGGAPILEFDYRKLNQQFFGAATGIKSVHPKLQWQNGVNQWCVFGYLLNNDAGLSLRGLKLGDGRRFFAATGSGVSGKIDLYLADTQRRIVAADEAPNAYPLLEYNAQSSEVYDLRIEVGDAQENELLLMGIFRQ
jgi:hypothetical protein